MKLTEEQYQQILNSITNKTVDLSFIREAEVEDIVHQFKTTYPQMYDDFDEEIKETLEQLVKYKSRGLN